MSNPYFQFKQFTVWHDRCAMKVGTDGVLLGAWAPVDGVRRILDVGTGTGLVALMLAQRSLPAANIVALEIDAAAAGQAEENVARSPWSRKIQVVNADFKQYRPAEKFDLIVSNPPYFARSLKCPDEQRSFARHDDSLTYQALMKGVSALLAEDGFFTVVIPTDRVDEMKAAAFTYDLYAEKRLDVVTRAGKKPKRTLMVFSFVNRGCEEEEIVMETAPGAYSAAFAALIREFYLKG